MSAPRHPLPCHRHWNPRACGHAPSQEQLAPLRAAHARVVGAELRRDAELDAELDAEVSAEISAELGSPDEAERRSGAGQRGGGGGGAAAVGGSRSPSDRDSFSSDSGRPRTHHGVPARRPAARTVPSRDDAATAASDDARDAAPAAAKPRAGAGGAAWLREQAAALQREGEAARSAALIGFGGEAGRFSISPSWLRG